MGVRINTFRDEDPTELPAGEYSRTDDNGNLTVEDRDSHVVARFATGYWQNLVYIPKTDYDKQLEEALQLLSEVDNGSFTNQDSDWQTRVDELLQLNRRDTRA